MAGNNISFTSEAELIAVLQTVTVNGKVNNINRAMPQPNEQSTPALLAVQHPVLPGPVIEHPIAALKQLWNAPAAIAARPLMVEFLKAHNLLRVALYQDTPSTNKTVPSYSANTNILMTIDNPSRQRLFSVLWS